MSGNTLFLHAVTTALCVPLFVFSFPVAAHGPSDEQLALAALGPDRELHLDAKQMQLAEIELMPVAEQAFDLDAVATATLKVNRDNTVTLAPQLDVRVLRRHVVPGQQVQQGQPLLTLGGAAVAQAQADYINAAAEWRRVQKMSPDAVSERERLQHQVDAELKRAILQALKMTPQQIAALSRRPADIGSYQLLAPIAGRVQQDIAQRGQVFSAGSALMQLTDESSLWVEAQLTPTQARMLAIGASAQVRVGEQLLPATIIGRSHELSAVTRTEQVLAKMANPGHKLHAGQFAELYLTGSGAKGVVLPDTALSRSSDGHWQVFIAQQRDKAPVAGESGFIAREVTVLQRQRGMNLVAGLHDDQQVVISGAFFLASEQAKAGFDIHNH